jgi:hypothetical protein
MIKLLSPSLLTHPPRSPLNVILEMPFSPSTTNKPPSLSKTIPLGPLNPFATTFARHPLATLGAAFFGAMVDAHADASAVELCARTPSAIYASASR